MLSLQTIIQVEQWGRRYKQAEVVDLQQLKYGVMEQELLQKVLDYLLKNTINYSHLKTAQVVADSLHRLYKQVYIMLKKKS
jgi:hypothetical protein